MEENLENPYLEKFYNYLPKHEDEYNPFTYPMQKYFIEKNLERLKTFKKDKNIFIQERFLIEQYEIFEKTKKDQKYINKK